MIDPNTDCRNHRRDDAGVWEEYDGHGVYLCLVCNKCVATKLARYRPDIMEAYLCDEPIDEE